MTTTLVAECGEVFCDTCGDCIYCFGEFLCVDGKPHIVAK